MKIEVVTDDAFGRLEQLSIGASRIRVALAYWTIPAADLPASLVNGMKDGVTGYVCCDIHNPSSMRLAMVMRSLGLRWRYELVDLGIF